MKKGEEKYKGNDGTENLVAFKVRGEQTPRGRGKPPEKG